LGTALLFSFLHAPCNTNPLGEGLRLLLKETRDTTSTKPLTVVINGLSNVALRKEHSFERGIRMSWCLLSSIAYSAQGPLRVH